MDQNKIDLLDITALLWNGRKFVLSATALTFSVALTAISILPKTFDASIVVQPIDNVSALEFQQLEDQLQDTIYYGRTNRETSIQEGSRLEELSPNRLISEFASVLLLRNTLASAASITGFIDPDGFATSEDYQAYLWRKVSKIRINPITILAPTVATQSTSATQSYESTGWKIQWTGSDMALSRDFISSAIELTNETTRLNLIEQITAAAEGVERRNARREHELLLLIENATRSYDIMLEDQIAYLTEQASLARSLNLEMGDIQPISSSVTARASGVEDRSEGVSTRCILDNSNQLGPDYTMSYLNGYRAIEQQISLLLERGRSRQFVPCLRELEYDLHGIRQDDTASILLASLQNSPLANQNEFKAAQVDFVMMEIRMHRNPYIVLTLSILVGLFFGSVFILSREILRSKPEIKSTT